MMRKGDGTMKRLISAVLILILLISLLSVGLYADGAQRIPLATSQTMMILNNVK